MQFSTRDGLTIEYDTFGDPTHPPILLVMGFAMQMIAWPESLCEQLADAGHYVIRFDNRDIGLSSRIDARAPSPHAVLTRKVTGLPVRVPYRIADMAHDAVDLLDHLKIDRVHAVGASMGGMIVQWMAINHGTRLASMTSIMSTTGEFRYAFPRLSVMRLMLTPPGNTLAERVEYGKEFWAAVGSPSDRPSDEELERDLTTYFERSDDLSGRVRQLAAIGAESSRVKHLNRVTTPTLVMHGLADPLISPRAGIATARAIPDAGFVGFQGMGHDLRPRFLPRIGKHIIDHVRQSGH